MFPAVLEYVTAIPWQDLACELCCSLCQQVLQCVQSSDEVCPHLVIQAASLV